MQTARGGVHEVNASIILFKSRFKDDARFIKVYNKWEARYDI